ncbi:MAG: OmpA family protein [Bacteroidales bacterium]|nr:OmpA family protein [Bacteroidales bacterium]
MKKLLTLVLCASFVLSGCGNMSNLGKGTAIGGGSGAAVGAALGLLLGKDAKSAGIGAAIGTAVGAGVGALIGNKMDKKAEELANLEGANVEVVKDGNDLDAIKVTFESGILFKTNSATLSDVSKKSLKEFAAQMADLPDTDVTVLGHTDNTGSEEYNAKLSLQRAEAVASYLKTCGMDKNQMKRVEGMSYKLPIADNATAEGRLQNRRVEIYISASEKMIKDAEAGNLK